LEDKVKIKQNSAVSRGGGWVKPSEAVPRIAEENEMDQSYVYIQTESNLFTVGFYDPSEKWHPESDHETKEEAAKRVHYLNGGN
jgi:hypothetical protein